MRFKIAGGKRLSGQVRISGAKNAMLKLMAASLLCDGECKIGNVPRITDVETMAGVIEALGAKVSFGDDATMLIDTRAVQSIEPPEELVREMRASIQVMGPLLARFGKVRIRQPGGCNLGPRPIDLHLKGFAALGANIKEEYGYVSAEAKRLLGADIHLDFPSVGATENIMTAACLAEGTTVIRNAAREPEIVDQQNFLNRMGARIRGAGTDTIKVRGVDSLTGTDYTIIPDRIEAGTYMVAIAMSRGDAWVEGVIPEHVGAILAKLREGGVEVYEEGNRVRISAEGLRAINVRSLPYPGFPTDMQPQIVAFASVASGTSIITESIFPNRFRYADELRRMGANIRIEGSVAVVEGARHLWGACVEAPDLRGGAALVLAGLVACGTTIVSGVSHIARGYEDMAGKLRGLGADIQEVE